MNILGWAKKIFKNPVQKDVELGSPGNTIFDGFITDEDYVPELTGLSALDIYNKMRRSDGVVRAALLACELPIRAANWYIEPASDDPKDQEVADFVSTCLFERMTITWDDFLRQALLMLPFGYMVFEKVFGETEIDGRPMIKWKKFAPRLPNTIMRWTTEDGEDGVTQQLVTSGTVSIPIEKLLIFTHNKEGDNWVGISVLRSAYRPWYFKKHIEQINAIAFERQGLGIPFAKMPKNFTPADRKKAEEILKNIRANEQAHIIEPNEWGVDFKDMKANTVKDPSASIRRYNREILISVLAQFLDLGSGPNGSRALSADHSSTFHNNLTAIARQVKDVINKYGIRQLVDLNYTVTEYPTLKFSNIGLPRYEGLAKAVSSLVQHGAITTDPELEDALRQIMNLPKKPEEEEEEGEKPKEVPKEKELKPEEKKEASEFASWRSLTLAENKINLKDIQRKMNVSEDGMRSELKKLMSKISNDLIRQFQIVLEAPSSKEKRRRLKEMSVHYKPEYQRLVFHNTKEMFQYGKIMAAHEMKKDPPTSPAASIQDLSKQADALTQIMEDDLMKAGKLAFLTGIQHMSFSATDTVAGLTKAIRRAARSVIFNVPAIVIGGSINQGRRASFGAYKGDIYALQRSEILDSVTCNYCMSVDSRIFRKNDSFTRNDGFHSSCRGLWVEIMKEEIDKPAITGIPKTLREGFTSINIFRPPRHPIVKKDSPAAEFIREEERMAEINREEIERAKEKVAKDAESLIKLNETIKDTIDDEPRESKENRK